MDLFSLLFTGEYFTKKRNFCQRPRQWHQIFAYQMFGKILTKTSTLLQNCIGDDMVRRNWQNI